MRALQEVEAATEFALSFSAQQIGCECEALRLTDLWYSTMRAGAVPHTRSRSPKKETLRTLLNR
jgi:hypothetical protein